MFVIKSASLITLNNMEHHNKHLNTNSLPGERPLDRSRVEELKAEIKGKTFNNCIWVIAIHKATGKHYRADGQHTATALSETPKELFPFGSVVLIIYYEIDNLKEDASNLFLRIDDSDAVRNPVATMNSVAFRYKDLHDVTPKFIVTAMNGIVYHLKELNQQHKKKGELDQLIPIRRSKLRGLYLADEGYRLLILWLNHWNTLTDEKGNRRKARNEWLMRKPAIIAEAMDNYFTYSEAARVFWNYVFDDAGPDGHATKKLVDKFNKWVREREVHGPDQWRSAVKQCWKQFLPEFESMKGKAKKAS